MQTQEIGQFQEYSILECPICSSADRAPAGVAKDERFGYPGTFSYFECSNCEALYLGNRIRPEHLGDVYSTYYKTQTVENGTLQSTLLQRLKNSLRVLFPDTIIAGPIKEYSSVIEIGPGMRPLQDRINWRGKKYFAVEYDTRALEVLKTRFGRGNASSELSDLLAQNADLPAECCVADQVLEHLYDPKSFLTEIRSAIAPGGKVFLATPSAESAFRRTFGNSWIGWHAPYHVVIYSRKSIALLASQCGFSVEAINSSTPASWARLQKETAHETFSLFWQIKNRLLEILMRRQAGDNLFIVLRAGD